MSRFMNQKFAALEAYTPGEQPKDMQYIKLNTNESPFPPSKSVLDAVNSKEVAKLNLYPDPVCSTLKKKLSELYSVKPENVFVSNGSDDILNFSFMAFCNDADHPVKFPAISYGFYRVYAELYGVSYEAIPLAEDFSIRVEDYLGNNANVVIANPNAPTGLALSHAEIEQIVRANPDFVVVIDEAYVDFGAESCVDLIDRYDNLLVVRTYSKSRSMAGARLGFAFGNAELITDLEKIKFSTNPYNINRLTLRAGEAAIDEDAYYMENCKTIATIREWTQEKLRALGFTCTDSRANFIFAKHERVGGKALYLALKERGILVRHFDSPAICDYNRITVGTKEQMETLVKTISSIITKE
ncbi:MAG: histidinol-phosphate transaminase [Clostridia bacterium]|nr:histidinol-phosphate transaminase [Clostridia bacterium]